MERYVDGYVMPLPVENVETYRRIASKSGEIWREHGALEYRECVGDALDTEFGLPFPKGLNLKDGETVVFSWIVYESKAQRDEVNAKVMQDPRMKQMCGIGGEMPFDPSRMMMGGFRMIIDD